MGGASVVQQSQTSDLAFSLYLFYAISYFLHFTTRVPGIAVVRPDLLLVLGIAGMLIVAKVRMGEGGPANTARLLNWLFIYIVVSLPFVEYPGSVIRKGLPDLLKVAVFFYFTYFIVDTDKRLRKFVIVVIGCQVFRVFEPLYLNLTTGYWGDAAYLGGSNWLARLAGAPSDVVNPNGLAFLVITAMPFLHYTMLSSRKFIVKCAYFGLLMPLLYALMLTGSRSGFVGLAVVVAMFIWKSKHRLVVASVCALTVMVAVPMMTPDQRDRYLSLTDDQTKGAATREGRIHGMWQDFEVGMKRPVFGFGIGTSKEANWNFARRGAKVSHTLYAEALMEIGMVGSVIFYCFLISMIRGFLQAKKLAGKGREENHDEGMKYYAALLDAIQVWVVMCMVFSIAQYGLSEFHWYLVAGLTAAVMRLVQARLPESAKKAPKTRTRQLAAHHKQARA